MFWVLEFVEFLGFIWLVAKVRLWCHQDSPPLSPPPRPHPESVDISSTFPWVGKLKSLSQSLHVARVPELLTVGLVGHRGHNSATMSALEESVVL